MKLQTIKFNKIKATLIDGQVVIIEENLTFANHHENCKKIKGITSIETMDGRIFQTV